MAALAIGHGHHHDEPADPAVGDEVLAPVDHPAVAIATRHGPHRGRIAAGAGLGQPPRPQHLPAHERPQIALLLLAGSEHRDVRYREAIVRSHREGNRRIDARQLLDADAIVNGGQARPSLGLGHLNAHQAEAGQLRDQIGRKRLRLVPLHDMRPDFGLGKLAHGLAKQILFGRQAEIHEQILNCPCRARCCVPDTPLMKHVLVVVTVAALLIGMHPSPAAADVTAFWGFSPTPATRSTRGFAIGLSLIVVGFEFEYANISEDEEELVPGLRTGMFNGLVQTPTRTQLYLTAGGGFFRESIGEASANELRHQYRRRREDRAGGPAAASRGLPRVQLARDSAVQESATDLRRTQSSF